MKYRLLFLSLVLFIQGGLPAQEHSLKQLEDEFIETELAVSELIKQRDDLKKRLNRKAAEIQKLKNETSLNIFERQKLEGLLKDSQDLSTEISAVDAKFAETNQNMDEIADRLIDLYESEIQKSLNNLETRDLSKAHRKTVLKNIEKLRKKKDVIKQKIQQQMLFEFKLRPLKIETDDTHKQIEQKGDLLKDQEDKFRAIAKTLNQQKNDLQKELNLRNRIDDLVTDLALFDQQEEVLSNLQSQDVSRAFNQNSPDQSEGTRDDLNVGSSKNLTDSDLFFVGLKDFNFSVLSGIQLQDIIEKLAQQEQLAKMKADSLGKRAETFYKAAKNLKK